MPRDDSPTPIPKGTSALTKLSASLGIVAAMVLAVLVNIFVSRHYKRWDWTRGGVYTLSDATTETLHALPEPLHVYVLLPAGDPLSISVENLLDAYRGETSNLLVEPTDPDRHPAEFLAVQQRFGIVAGKTEDGKIVTDAAIVVARGDVPHFITLRDLVETDEDNDLKRRPRIEQALTSAIRSVISKDRPRACFTTGHGEGAIEPGAGPAGGGLSPFRDSLVKNNFEVQNVGEGDSDAKALDGCRVLIIAGPKEKIPAEDVAQYKTYAEKGGNVFVAVGPAFDAARQRYIRRGLDDLLGLFGIKQAEDFVFELEPKARLPQGYGEAFLPQPRPHAITEGLLKAQDRGLAVVLTVASSLAPTGAGAAAPAPLLATSDRAFGMVDFAAWSRDRAPPVAGSLDHKGPLTVAFASELPRRAGDASPHGPRLVVVGSASALYGANWQADELRAGAVFVESAIAWLAARPALLDIPSKPTFTAGLQVSDAWLASTFRYVVIYMPLACALLGAAVYLRRRSTERTAEAAVKAAPEEPPKVAPKKKRAKKKQQ